MGDPKKQRKKYSTPAHMWEADRIEDEKEIIRNFGLKNKKEAWKMRSILKGFAARTKILTTSTGKQSEIESASLLNKLKSYNLLPQNATLGDALGISLNDILERRLQSIVVKRDLARSMKQARQFIVHAHITVSGKKITSPSYLVSLSEETTVAFVDSSALSDPDHPEREIKEKESAEKKKEPAKKKTAAKKPKKAEEKPKKADKIKEKKEDSKDKKTEEKPKKEEKKDDYKSEEKKEESKEKSEK